ncbi:MAG: leucine-rich repeat protein [Clostridia bacterium]
MPPETILNGRYLVGRVLGFGGFGTTYIAWDLVLEKKVAIKEYMPSDFATRAPGETQLSVYDGELGEQFEAGLKSFIDESRRLAKFNHEDGIVHIFDSFLENGTAYIVMEYLEGKTLKELLKEHGGKIPYEEAVGYILPVLKSLDAVHQTGIIHRDIAPDNIFLTNDGKVKLIDFGASRYATTLHSKSLSVILKQGYAPEEQYRSHGEQGPWSDVYAVCATLYRAITGIVPEDALERCANDKLVPPSKMGIQLPQGIENAILNGLNTKAENRIQSAKELAQALSGEIEVQRVKEEKKKEDVGKWSKKQIIIASCSGVAVLAVIILAVLGVFSLNKSLDTTLYATVPDYIGMTLDEAQADWASYCETEGITNISLSVLDGVTADTITGYEVNSIYAVAPEVGSWFKKAEEEQKYLYVTVVLKSVQQMIEENQGKDSWVMQNLENYSQADAQRILESMVGVNFTFETIASEKSAGTVIRTEPAAGTQINKGDTIVVYISDGSQINVVETVDEEVVRQEEEANNGGNFFDNLFDNLRPGNDEDKNNEPSTSPESSTDSGMHPSESGPTDPTTPTDPTEPHKYTLTVSRRNGIASVTGTGQYEAGTNVTVTATVSSGYEFTGWTSSNTNLVLGSSNVSYTFRMPAANITLTANADKLQLIAHGTWGKDGVGDNTVNWAVYSSGLLSITGNGPMGNGDSEVGAPWCASQITGQDIPVNIEKVVISEGITSIGDYAFLQCKFLTDITIPNSVQKIGKGAFLLCTKLRNITLPSGIDSIPDYAFYSCYNLQRVNIPNTVLRIGALCFWACFELEEIAIPNSVTFISDGAFGQCNNLKSILIPHNVTTMGARVFEYWSSSQTIYIEGYTSAPEGWWNDPVDGWDGLCYAQIVWNV